MNSSVSRSAFGKAQQEVFLTAYRNFWTDASVGSYTLDAGLWMLDSGQWTLDSGTACC